jgi:hypothetical protein
MKHISEVLANVLKQTAKNMNGAGSGIATVQTITPSDGLPASTTKREVAREHGI